METRPTFAIPVLAACLLFAGNASAQSPAAPDPKEIAEAGQRSLARFQSEGAVWSVEIGPISDETLTVNVLAAANRRVTKVSVRSPRGTGEMVRIIERDGVWYVLEEGKPLGKYRPHEAPFSVPGARLFLAVAEPAFIVDPGQISSLRYESCSGGVGIYRASLPEQLRTMLSRILKQVQELLDRAPSGKARKQLEQQQTALREMLERGVRVEIDLANGLIVGRGDIKTPMALRDFRWVKTPPEEAFDISGHKWPDHTGDPTEGVDPNDLVMFGHCRGWRVGMKDADTDTCLMNLKTGEMRRVPYRGPISATGCFLEPRTRVVVSGMDVENGALSLFEVDLRTGANRRLGGELLTGGHTLMPAASRDGTKVAALFNDFSAGMLASQVVVIDVKTGKATKIGKPMDTAFLSWLPDTGGLILITREFVAYDKPAKATVARMSLDGTITPIVRGNEPVLLADGKTILFEGDDDRLWRTCDLAGQNVKLFADGLRGYGSPSPSPPGDRILWSRVDPHVGPRPVILKIGSTTPTPAVTGPGLWLYPTWR